MYDHRRPFLFFLLDHDAGSRVLGHLTVLFGDYLSPVHVGFDSHLKPIMSSFALFPAWTNHLDLETWTALDLSCINTPREEKRERWMRDFGPGSVL